MTSASSPEPEGGCFLCEAAEGGSALTVDLGATTVTLLNRYPYNPGHVMVAPLRHVPDLIAGGDELAADIMVAARRAMRAIDAAVRPDGYNVGVNHGPAAGASVEHVHLHVVPRWNGDTNFMPVVGATKVLPEDLETTAVKLRRAFGELD